MNVKQMNNQILEAVDQTIYMSDDEKNLDKLYPFSFKVKDSLGLVR